LGLGRGVGVPSVAGTAWPNTEAKSPAKASRAGRTFFRIPSHALTGATSSVSNRIAITSSTIVFVINDFTSTSVAIQIPFISSLCSSKEMAAAKNDTLMINNLPYIIELAGNTYASQSSLAGE
jgi:hypothetical protein